MRLVGVAEQEEHVARPDRAGEEDRSSRVQHRAVCAKCVVRDDDLALPTVERDAACSQRNLERALRGRNGDVERDARPDTAGSILS